MTRTGLSTAELLDHLEARIQALRESATTRARQSAEPAAIHWEIPVASPDPATAHEMRVLLQLAGWTQSAFAEKFHVPLDTVRDWLSGERGVPVWVLPVLRMLEQLTPAMQQQAFRRRAQPAGTNRKRNAHPFARIEEL